MQASPKKKKKKRKGKQDKKKKTQGNSMGACLIEEGMTYMQFGLTMQECSINIVSTHDHTDDLTTFNGDSSMV